MIAAILLAVSTISSEGLWSFMKQPENGFTYPSSVSSAHTFGSPGHKDSSSRIVKDDLAAIETLFEAYYERVFFASEGLSNDWDVAEYGPRATTDSHLRDVSFAASNGGERVRLAYSPETRYMPGTMRFAETNLVNVYPTVIQDLIDNGCGNAKLLDRGVTWGGGLGRKVWWACSKFDYSEMPEPFDWAYEWPYSSSFTSNFVPIRAFYMSDHEFPAETTGQSERHFAYDLLAPVLQRREDWESAIGSTEPMYYFVGTNSVFRQLNKVLGCRENLEYATFTQRLVPDEYVEVSASFRDKPLGSYDSAWTEDSHGRLMAWEPWFELRSGFAPGERFDGWLSFVGSYERHSISGGGFMADVTAGTLPWRPEQPRLGLRLSVPDEAAEQDPVWAEYPNYGGVGAFVCYADDSGVVTNGEWRDVGSSFLVDYIGRELVTNSVTTNVSYLASTARILACHDRTMEVPAMDAYADCHVSNRYETCERIATCRTTRAYPVSVDRHTMTFSFDNPVRLSELDYGDAKEWSTNRVEYGPQSDQAVDCAEFDDVQVAARASFDAFGSSPDFPDRFYYSEITEDLSYAGQERPATLTAGYDRAADAFVCSIRFESGASGPTHRTENFFELHVEPTLGSVQGTAEFSASGTAGFWYTVHPSRADVEFRRLFPAYTPGKLGASRVRSAVCPMVASAVFDYGLLWSGGNASTPPFTWDEVGPWNARGIEYACAMTEFSTWNASSSFPEAYTAMRRSVLLRIIDEVIPSSSLHDMIPVDKGSYELSSLTGQCAGGTITFTAEPAIPDTGSFSVVYDQVGACIGFSYAGSDGVFRTNDFVSASIAFYLGGFVGESVPPLFTPQTGKSATGRTSGAIVADWDFHALKLVPSN